MKPMIPDTSPPFHEPNTVVTEIPAPIQTNHDNGASFT